MNNFFSKKLITLFVLAIIIFLSNSGQVFAAGHSLAYSENIESKLIDERTLILKAYFKKYNSPLEESANDFIEAADTYNLNWRLVPAIAGVESTFGKRIPGGYNAWGWGVYGTQAIYFTSWRHGIFTVSEGLRKNYINKGYITPFEMNRIYASSPVWGRNVSYFLADIEKFEAEYKKTDVKETASNMRVQTAGSSAQIARIAPSKIIN